VIKHPESPAEKPEEKIPEGYAEKLPGKAPPKKSVSLPDQPSVYSRMTLQASQSFSRVQAALAGLVEGRMTALAQSP
jgi:hypothetical protein